MAASAALLALLFLQTPAPAKTPRHATRVAAAAHTPATPEALRKELNAVLQSASFAGDSIHCAIQGHDITLVGTVHQAEHKGLATRAARAQARKAHWTGYEVRNQITVSLSGSR